MRRRGIVVIPVVGSVLLLSAGFAVAQCAFDAPTKAKGIKTSMVRAYAGCPGITFPSPNTSTMAGVPGCTPPMTQSAYEFDDETSGCSIRLAQSVESPCFDGAPACGRIKLKARCWGILDPGGATLTESPGWSLSIIARITIADETSGDMTIIDFPAQFSSGQASRGKLKLTYDSSDPCAYSLCNLFPPPAHAFPVCTTLEIPSARILDPDGNIFAAAGTSSR